DLVVIRGVNADRTASVDDFKASCRREGLLEMIVKVVALAEDAVEVAVVDVDVVANSGPVDAFQLGRNQTKNDDHDHQENSARANPGGTSAFPLRALMFEQFDHAPENQQHRPVTGEQVR